MKKILSLDGGGIRGIIPALVLQSIEEELQCRIADIFDLIVGTSTGGILALGLSKDGGNGGKQGCYSAAELAEIYNKYGKVIFNRDIREKTTVLDGMARLTRSFLPSKKTIGSNEQLAKNVEQVEKVLSHIEGLTDEKYSDVGLVSVLNEFFGAAMLQNVRNDIKVMVTCYDIQARSPVFLKNWYPKYRSLRMADAARATAAAPTYFEPIELDIGDTTHVLVDGGIFVNTPTVSAYAEAKSVYPDETDFFLLSLGTGSFTRPFLYNQAQQWGKLEWVSPLIDCIFDGQQDAANYHMRCLLEPKNYHRFTPELDDDTDEMDNIHPKNLERLHKKASEITNSNDFGKFVDRLKQLV